MARSHRRGSSDRFRPPRVFIFQALSAWAVLEATGQTEQLAPDIHAWLHSILEGEVPHVQRISRVKPSIPKH